MSKIIFAETAWEEYQDWQKQDRKTIKRINKLIEDIARNGNAGIGKPEPLRYRYGWSRRIDESNRLVYTVESDSITIVSCKGHYDD